MNFGQLLRRLRLREKIGIKRLAPELGVSYTYLSKLENGGVNPSERTVSKVARYFRLNEDELLLSAGKVPPEVLRILRDNPAEAIDLLRQTFGRKSR